jgi:hypothetical protein
MDRPLAALADRFETDDRTASLSGDLGPKPGGKYSAVHPDPRRTSGKSELPHKLMPMKSASRLG